MAVPRANARRTACLTTALLAVVACDAPLAPSDVGPNATSAARARRLTTADGVVAQDLGVLPGATNSTALFVFPDGSVSGLSDDRPFLWTEAGGMVETSDVLVPRLPEVVQPAATEDFTDVWAAAANYEGESVGALCTARAPEICPAVTFAFRWSRAEGLRALERTDLPIPELLFSSSAATGVNGSGHVAGFRSTPAWRGGEFTAFFWTPEGGFTDVAPVGGSLDQETTVLVGEEDQVVGAFRAGPGAAIQGFAWRPEWAAALVLPNPAGERGGDARPADQNPAGVIVGTAVVAADGDGEVRHAVRWTVPAVSRTGYPAVDVNAVRFTSRISLRTTGGLYYQIYRVTAAPGAGRVRETIDWGDGTTTSRTVAAAGNATSQAHRYHAPGTYRVRVYARDAVGRWTMAERVLTVTR